MSHASVQTPLQAPEPFMLTTTGDAAFLPVLRRVQAHGQVDGTLATFTLSQTYRNDSPQWLEVVYTFPLPAEAVLLGFSSVLNGQRMTGKVLPRRAAEHVYESARTDGDSPVMLELGSTGLCTANLGNLQPGDEVTLEVTLAQPLRIEQGRVRLSLPTTVAPRHGNPQQAGLQPQQVPTSSLSAEYPFEFSIDLSHAWAAAKVTCPTHAVVCTATESGRRVQCRSKAWLDRDLVLTLEPPHLPQGILLHGRDRLRPDAPHVALAQFTLPPQDATRPVRLHLLVDGSGSMAGDGVHSARSAVQALLNRLTPQDTLAITRFGSHVQEMLALTECTDTARRVIGARLTDLNADLGGTEMEEALLHVMQLDSAAPKDILLLTDGNIWGAHDVSRQIRAGRHRLFVVGLGAASAEGVIRQLAAAGSGACEFATPGESLEGVAQRMLHRMRQPLLGDCRIDWGAKPVWQTTPTTAVFAGDTVTVLAGFEAQPAAGDIHLHVVNEAAGPMTAQPLGIDLTDHAPGDTLARLAAHQRLANAAETDEDEALQLAVDYQLMTLHTHCVMVHAREHAEASVDEAPLHRVSSMVAAGWAGTAMVLPTSPLSAPEPLAASAVWRSARQPAAPNTQGATPAPGSAMPDIPSFLLKQDHRSSSAMLSMEAPPAFTVHRAWDALARQCLLEVVQAHWHDTGTVNGLGMACADTDTLDLFAADVALLTQGGCSPDEAWAFLAWYIQPSSPVGADLLACLVRHGGSRLDELIRLIRVRQGHGV